MKLIPCLLAAAVAALSVKAATPGAPNFVVIMAEAQGWANTSVQMDDRIPSSRSTVFRTPAIERLAREGMRFALGYAASPRCTPSRAALLTGKTPAALQMTYVGVGRGAGPVRTALIPPEPVLELPTREVTVAELLREAGYATAHFGKWHLGRANPSQHGFDASDGPTSNGGPDNVANPNPTEAIGMTERGIVFARKAVAAGRPFYLHLSHYPNQERKEGARAGRTTGVQDADEIDRTVTRLLAALDELGVARNTFVIYTADHGAQGRNGNAPLSGGKGAVTEGGLRVPFLIRGPGITGGACSHVPVTACDLLPTMARLAGLTAPLPAGVEGGDLGPVLRDPQGRGRVARPREELVFHFPHYDLGNGGPATALIAGRYKLVRSYEQGTRRLYDLERDPGEERDLSESLAEQRVELDARLTEYLRAISAQMARPNPDYDPSKAPPAEEARGARGGGRKGRP